MSIDFTDDGPDDPEDEQSKRVNDDEGNVDRKIKDRILKARERVDTREDQLFVQAPAMDVRMSQEQALNAWATSIRQYIRVVKPLLTSDEIEGAQYYWTKVPLGGREISPPDGEKEWSRFAYSDDPNGLATQMGLPPSFDPPEAKTASFTGLQEIMNRQTIEKHWTVDMKPDAILPQENLDSLTVKMPVPKSILEKAVEATDAFLQEAGVGLEIGGDDPHGKT
jgi:hypothetical protein